MRNSIHLLGTMRILPIGAIRWYPSHLGSILLLLMLASPLLAASPGSNLDRTVKFDIPAQTVESALLTFSQQAHVQILIGAEASQVSGTPTFIGTAPVRTVLDAIIRDSGLKYTVVGNSVSVVRATDVSTLSPAVKHVSGSDQALTASETGADTTKGRKQDAIEEVVVTAQKRTERLQDVSESISVLTTEEILRRGITDMDDYLRGVPGVSRMETGSGRANPLVIRGLSLAPESDKASVGIYLGEIPLTNSLFVGDHFGAPDVALVDMAQVEVLKGPQGTLYGSGSLSGVVRNQPVEPNLHKFEGSATVGVSNTAVYGGDNYQANAVVNIPLVSDILAVRIVGYHFDDSGYVKNVDASGKPGIPSFVTDAQKLYGAQLVNQDNQGRVFRDGIRAAILWHPTELFDAKYTYLHQRTNQDGEPEVLLSLGKYEQAFVPFAPYSPRPLGNDSTLNIHNVVLDLDLQWAKVLSSTSDSTLRSRYGRDVTEVGLGPLDEVDVDTFREFAQEVRMISNLTGPFQYLVGGFYENSRGRGEGGGTNRWIGSVDGFKAFYGPTPSKPFFGAPFAPLTAQQYQEALAYLPMYADGLPTSGKITQKAEFGEVSVEPINGVKATAGARHFSYNTDTAVVDQLYLPALGYSPGVYGPNISSHESGQVYKAGLSYKPTSGILVYSTWSQGFRLGSPATPISPLCGDFTLPNGDTLVPGAVKSDRTNNYEIGAKTSFLNGQAHVDASVYRVDWSRVPITVFNANGSCAAQFNAGDARSRGVDLEAGLRIARHWDLELGASFTDAKLTQDVPSFDVPGSTTNGARLPGSPKFSGKGSVSYDFQAYGRNSYVRTDLLYVGTYYNNLQQAGEAAGGYFTANLNTGVQFSSTLLEFYVNNLTNAEKLTWVYATITADERAFRLRPRTIGARLSWKF
jgi:iron complex outermembrane recepter protein